MTSDWIEACVEFTSGIPSPEIFRRWAAISAIGAALERRVWLQSAKRVLYPNLFVLLVGPPATGKTQAVDVAREFWRGVKDLKVAPDNMTKSALLDTMKASSRQLVLGPTEAIEYSSLIVAADELGVFVSGHDTDFLSHINKIWDNPATFTESRRGGNQISKASTPLEIIRPQLNILAGTQPAFLGVVFPEEAWGMGTTSRFVMVYSSEIPKVDLWAEDPLDEERLAALHTDFGTIASLYGQMKVTTSVREQVSDWWKKGGPPTPTHSRLEHYTGRRILVLLRLCMISSISRNNSRIIEDVDFDRALEWMVEAEEAMPDIFRTMSQKSDAQVLKDLHFFVFKQYNKTGRKGVHEGMILHFLQTKAPTDRVEKILDIAIKIGMLRREAGKSTYTPAPENEFGLE